jgi:hypothetical protein
LHQTNPQKYLLTVHQAVKVRMGKRGAQVVILGRKRKFLH